MTREELDEALEMADSVTDPDLLGEWSELPHLVRDLVAEVRRLRRTVAGDLMVRHRMGGPIQKRDTALVHGFTSWADVESWAGGER